MLKLCMRSKRSNDLESSSLHVHATEVRFDAVAISAIICLAVFCKI